MKIFVNPEKNFISCSKNHAAAIGAYGHLYVWGSNLGPIDTEKIENSSEKSSENSGESIDAEFYHQLGIFDTDIETVKSPIFYKLNHPFYRPEASHVSCGKYFTAVIGVEKDKVLENEISEVLFDLEIQDFMTELPPAECKIDRETYANVFLSNRIRKEIDFYIKENNMTFIDLFKSNIIKEQSFINIMTKTMKSKLTEQELRDFISYKKMRLPGNGISMKPLFELIMKCKQSKGFLYILGKKEMYVPLSQSKSLGYPIKQDSLLYYLIDLPEKMSVAKVSCGANFVLLLSHFGMVYSWGSENSAALGKNRAPNYNQIRPLTDLITEKSVIKDIVCGSYHCLALTTANSLFTWGEGLLGKLGNGRYENITRPELININNRDIVLIRAGHNSSFCKTKENLCYVWGDTSHNKFGNYSRPFMDRPCLFTYDFQVSDVAIGTTSSVLLSNTGKLHQYSVTEDFIIELSKKYKHLDGFYFFQVSGYGSKFFALNSKGSIFSWCVQKKNEGLGRPNAAEIPLEITICSQHFCVKDIEEQEAEVQSTPKISSSSIVGVCCAEENTVLITNMGEAVICGSNKYGQIGMANGDMENDDEFVSEYPNFRTIPRLSMAYKVSLKNIACGKYHMLAVTSEGSVLSWGANTSGQLGRNVFSSCEYPEKIKPIEKAKMVAAGDSHSLILTETLEVYAFGSAEHGKLGLGQMPSTANVSVPTKICGVSGMALVSCGSQHSLCLSEKGNLFLWGYGWNGQLGSGSRDSYSSPHPVVLNILWKEAVCGSSHTLAISREGLTYHWGEVNLFEEDSEIFTPTQVRGLVDIKAKKAYANKQCSAIVTEVGTAVYSWGKQIYRKILGTESIDGECTKPNNHAMPYGEKIKDFSLGPYHGALVTDQGRVFTWGCTQNGRIGQGTELKSKFMPLDGKELDLSHIFQKKTNSDQKAEEYISDLQKLLQDEPEELNEINIREVDFQIISRFNECIDTFVSIASKDSNQDSFFSKLEHKQLIRLQQEPFKCQYNTTDIINPEIKKRIYGYASLLTTFQIHCCYISKLFTLQIKEEKKIELMNMIYCDMENDYRLIYTAIYFSKVLLDKILAKENLSFPEFLEASESEIYKKLITKIIMANDSDMDKMRKLAADCIQSLSVVVNEDENGIDPNPLHTPKVASINSITAYQINRNIVDRRMNRLILVLRYFIDYFKKYNEFSKVIFLIIKDFLDKCKERFGINTTNFDPMNITSVKIVNTILSIVFEPFCQSIKNPYNHNVIVDVLFLNTEANFTSLSNAISAFFAGKTLGTDRWLKDVNAYIQDELNLELKIEKVIKILDNKADLEELYLESVFIHSLEPSDKVVTVPGQLLVHLHSLVNSNLEALRVNNPSYDPLVIISRTISPVPSAKIFGKNEHVNITLLTRALRQDQSIVRCPDCEMLIPRDMSPNNFLPVIELYDPMPPNSSVSILSQILATGPKKQKHGKLDDYIKNYRENYSFYLKNYEINDKVRILITNIDTINSALLGLPIEAVDDEERINIESNREQSLKSIELECEIQYKRRKKHSLIQYKISNILNHLFDVLSERMNSSFLDIEKQKKILFNIEYGASNLELENFSDPVMFSIYMKKIRDYTSKKEMSITLFENLTDEIKHSLRGFMKRSLRELMKKGIVADYSLEKSYKEKNIIFSFEIDNDALIVIVANSPSKLNICGRDEFREEEVLLYEKITAVEIAKMREESKQGNVEKIKVLSDSRGYFQVNFQQKQLLHVIGIMEDKVAAYMQNVKISQHHSYSRNSEDITSKIETLDNEKPEQLELLNDKRRKNE